MSKRMKKDAGQSYRAEYQRMVTAHNTGSLSLDQLREALNKLCRDWYAHFTAKFGGGSDAGAAVDKYNNRDEVESTPESLDYEMRRERRGRR